MKEATDLFNDLAEIMKHKIAGVDFNSKPETIKDITIRLNAAVDLLEYRQQHPNIFPSNTLLGIEILRLANELNDSIIKIMQTV